METIEIVVSPAPRPGSFRAMWHDREITTARTPLLASARVLLAEGVPPETEMVMKHAGNDMVCMRTTVGEAAKLRVIEDADGVRFGRYQPFNVEL